MKKVQKKVAALEPEHPDYFHKGVRYVMDNALWHQQWMNEHSRAVIRTPAHSFEFNKPVEHFHNAVKGEARRRQFEEMAKHCQGPAPDFYKYLTFEGMKKIVEKAVHTMANKKSLQKDAHTMPATFQAIIDAKGDNIDQEYIFKKKYISKKIQVLKNKNFKNQ